MAMTQKDFPFNYPVVRRRAKFFFDEMMAQGTTKFPYDGTNAVNRDKCNDLTATSLVL